MNTNTIITGNIGSIQDLRTTKTGKTVLNFSVAVNTEGQPTRWFRVTAWEALAIVVKDEIAKGSWVHLSGRHSETEYKGQVQDEISLSEISVYCRSMHAWGPVIAEPAPVYVTPAPPPLTGSGFAAAVRDPGLAAREAVAAGYSTEEVVPF